MIWYTSDSHFSHENIISYCNRPFSCAEEMNRTIVSNWNSIVSPDDRVFHLGDFCFSWSRDEFTQPRHLIQQLNGKITLIRGNHDKVDHLNQFHKTYQRYVIDIGPFHCLLNHRPWHPPGFIDRWKDSDRSIQYPDEYDFIVCGHVHNKWLQLGKNYNVGLDVHDFYPICQDELIKQLEKVYGSNE